MGLPVDDDNRDDKPAIMITMYDRPSSPPPVSRSCLAPLARRLLTTSVEPRKTAQCKGVTHTLSFSSFAALLGSAPLLRSKSAALSSSRKQARNSGVTCQGGGGGGGWAGGSPLCNDCNNLLMMLMIHQLNIWSRLLC